MRSFRESSFPGEIKFQMADPPFFVIDYISLCHRHTLRIVICFGPALMMTSNVYIAVGVCFILRPTVLSVSHGNSHKIFNGLCLCANAATEH